MAINITIVKSPEGVVPAEASKSFDERGGTLGRGADNQWVLSDPERFLSSRHCQVTCENGQFFLIDCSTNGTFVNGSNEPLGRNGKVALKDGDVFDMGDYRFSVSLWAVGQSARSPFDSQQTSRDDQFDSDSGFFGSGQNSQSSVFPQNAGLPDPFGSSPFPSELYNPIPEDSDPLAALDKAGRADSSDPFGANSFNSHFEGNSQFNSNSSDVFSSDSYSDGADALNQAANWPSTTHDSAMIPEDWDDDLLPSRDSPISSEPAKPIPRSLPLTDRPKARDSQIPERSKPKIPLEPQPEAPIRPTPARPKPSPRRPVTPPIPDRSGQHEQLSSTGRGAKSIPPKKSAPVSRSQGASAVDRSVIEAIGLGEFDLSDERVLEINAIVGEMVRETVIGMMQSLRSRATIKNEFRMNVTTIQPIENNPLKFSANIDDALENMFIKQSNAYKKPVEAVREGFQAVAEHQVALLAGIRSAFKSMVEGFNPEVMEKQFERQSKGSIVPALGKAKYWNAYKEHYKSLADNMENSFQYLFGDEFVQAYEDQLIRLSKTRDKR